MAQRLNNLRKSLTAHAPVYDKSDVEYLFREYDRVRARLKASTEPRNPDGRLHAQVVGLIEAALDQPDPTPALQERLNHVMHLGNHRMKLADPPDKPHTKVDDDDRP